MPEDRKPVYNSKPAGVVRQVFFSFKAAFEGLFHVLLTQRNMRFHFSIALWVMSFAIIFDVPVLQKAFFFFIITVIISLEVLNTCIEALVDLWSPDYNELAKIAKDTAAAAVLSASIGSVMAAGYLLIPPFIENAFSIEWLEKHHRELLALAIIIGSVLVFWIIRAIEFMPGLLLMVCAASASFALTLLAVFAQDFITFCAFQFFSVLLFNSMARSRNSLRIAITGHASGAAAFLLIRYFV